MSTGDYKGKPILNEMVINECLQSWFINFAVNANDPNFSPFLSSVEQ